MKSLRLATKALAEVAARIPMPRSTFETWDGSEVKTAEQLAEVACIPLWEAKARMKPSEQPQKCMYCKTQATKRIVHSEGMAYIPVCDDHLAKGKHDAERCTPDGTVDPSNIDAIREYKGLRRVRTLEGVRQYGQPIGSIITVDEDELVESPDPLPPIYRDIMALVPPEELARARRTFRGVPENRYSSAVSRTDIADEIWTETQGDLADTLFWARKFRDKYPGVAERLGVEHYIQDKYFPAWFGRQSQYHRKLTEEQVQAELVDRMREQISGAAVVVRRGRETTLQDILRSGRFKTQYETQTSKGAYAPDSRAGYEAMAFGYPTDLPPEERPVYGYLLPDGPESGADMEVGAPAGHYGPYRIVLKPEVRERTTFVVGDSLWMMSGLPSPMLDPDWMSFDFEWGPDGTYSQVDYGWARQQRGVGYIEAQIHGGIRIEDIQEVIIGPHADEPNEETIALLEQAGIPWKYVTQDSPGYDGMAQKKDLDSASRYFHVRPGYLSESTAGVTEEDIRMDLFGEYYVPKDEMTSERRAYEGTVRGVAEELQRKPGESDEDFEDRKRTLVRTMMGMRPEFTPDRVTGMGFKARWMARVRTPAGAKKYGLPIGALIVRDAPEDLEEGSEELPTFRPLDISRDQDDYEWARGLLRRHLRLEGEKLSDHERELLIEHQREYPGELRQLDLELHIERAFQNWAYSQRQDDLGEIEHLTDDQIKAEIEERMRAQIPTASIIIRRQRESTLRDILQSGRMKTQFETGTSSGSYDPDDRGGYERMAFGYPSDLPAEQRPVYGYLIPGGPDAGQDIERGSTVEHYGRIRIVLKPEVAERTTFMVGDSLNAMDGIPSPMTDPSWTSYRFGRNSPYGLYSQIDYSNAGMQRDASYIEAQIHGGVQVDDIQEVIFGPDGFPPDEKTQALLAERGVPWRHVTWDDFDFGHQKFTTSKYNGVLPGYTLVGGAEPIPEEELGADVPEGRWVRAPIEVPEGSEGWTADDLEASDAYLRSLFYEDPIDGMAGGVREPHPETGHPIKVGRHRRLARPEGDGEGPAEWVIDDYGTLEEHKLFPDRDVDHEPVRYVYRGMSLTEWNEAMERGFIQSDGRGVIADWEGTNAAISAASARSYLPGDGEPAVIALIRVEEADKWFTIRADGYLRTREPIPLDRIEMVTAPMRMGVNPESRYGRRRLERFTGTGLEDKAAMRRVRKPNYWRDPISGDFLPVGVLIPPGATTVKVPKPRVPEPEPTPAPRSPRGWRALDAAGMRFEVFTANPWETPLRQVDYLRLAGERPKGLTQGQVDAISSVLWDYMTEEGDAAPWAMRSAGTSSREMQLIKRMFAAAPGLSEDVQVWRGLSRPRLLFGDDMDGSLVGRTFTDPSVMSVTPDRATARRYATQHAGEDERILVRLDVPAGVKAATLGGEDLEMLLAAGQTFRVLEDIKGSTGGLRVIHAEVMPAAEPKKQPRRRGGRSAHFGQYREGVDIIDRMAVGEKRRTLTDAYKWIRDNRWIPWPKPSDRVLDVIAREQGWDAPGNVGSADDLDAAVEAGGTELWRGVSGYTEKHMIFHPDHFGDPEYLIEDPKWYEQSALYYHERVRTGEMWYGTGLYGQGVYTSVDQGVANTFGERPYLPLDPDREGGGYERVEAADPRSIQRMVLKPDARVITFKEIMETAPGPLDEVKAKLGRGSAGKGRPGIIPMDVGYIAALLGYDAVLVQGKHDRDNDPRYADQYIILNRTAVLFELPEEQS